MSDYSFLSSPSPSEATLAFEALHEGQGYSKAILETLGVTAILSPEEVMKRYQDGTAQAEGVVEWAEVRGICIQDNSKGDQEYYGHEIGMGSRIVAPSSEALTLPIAFNHQFGEGAIGFLDRKRVLSHIVSTTPKRLYAKRLILSPHSRASGGHEPYYWRVEQAHLMTIAALAKYESWVGLP